MAKLSIDFRMDPALKLERKLLQQKNGKLLIDVQGEFQICIDQSIFFREPSLALLELGVNLRSWRMKDPKAINNFYFFTMEHDEREGPILACIKKGIDEWHLFSIWQEFKHEDMIPTEVLLKAVDQYLVELEEVLVKKFAIRYSDFTKI